MGGMFFATHFEMQGWNLIFKTVRLCRTVARFSLLRKSCFVDIGRNRPSRGEFGQHQRKTIFAGVKMVQQSYKIAQF